MRGALAPDNSLEKWRRGASAGKRTAKARGRHLVLKRRSKDGLGLDATSRLRSCGANSSIDPIGLFGWPSAARKPRLIAQRQFHSPLAPKTGEAK